jgi:hypothetical protein
MSEENTPIYETELEILDSEDEIDFVESLIEENV